MIRIDTKEAFLKWLANGIHRAPTLYRGYAQSIQERPVESDSVRLDAPVKPPPENQGMTDFKEKAAGEDLEAWDAQED